MKGSKLEIKENFDIKNLTTFKIGGKIKKVFFPENVDEFAQILQQNPNTKVFGNLSNTLISSYGYDENIILTNKIDKIIIEKNIVTAGCGVKGPKLSQDVCKAGLSGLEFMIGFPGSVGGEICMNASAHGQCISDNLNTVLCYSPKAGIVRLSKDDMSFDYRTSRCERDELTVLEAEFELTPKNPDEIKKQMDENLNFRRTHQPSLALPNCGSIFKNPPLNPAGKLLESVGAKEVIYGGVRVWRNHANFIINSANGSSLDILKLMYELQQRVKEEYNIILEPEIKFLGGKNKEENELWYLLNKR